MCSKTLKYVRIENSIVLFSETLIHSTFKHLQPKSAGFCMINFEEQKATCYGESISLGIGSEEEDSILATHQIFSS